MRGAASHVLPLVLPGATPLTDTMCCVAVSTWLLVRPGGGGGGGGVWQRGLHPHLGPPPAPLAPSLQVAVGLLLPGLLLVVLEDIGRREFLIAHAPHDCPDQERWSPLNSGTESVWALWLWSLAAWALVLAPAAWALVEGGAAAWRLLPPSAGRETCGALPWLCNAWN